MSVASKTGLLGAAAPRMTTALDDGESYMRAVYAGRGPQILTPRQVLSSAHRRANRVVDDEDAPRRLTHESLGRCYPADPFAARRSQQFASNPQARQEPVAERRFSRNRRHFERESRRKVKRP